MVWPFKQESECDLFRIITAEPKDGDALVFPVVGEFNPETGHFDTHDHISALIRGRSRTEYDGYEPYESEDFACVNPLTGSPQCNPGVFGTSVPLEDLKYMSISTAKRRIGYNWERFTAPGDYRLAPPGGSPYYVFACRGAFEYGGKRFEEFEIHKHKGPRGITVQTPDDVSDCILFVVWERT